MIKEFKEFISQGSVLDTAVGIIIGAAFKAIIDSFIADLITPLLNVFLGNINFKDWVVTVGPINFAVGNFINNVLSFLVIGFVMFLLVKAANKMRKQKAATTKTCPHCQTEIPIGATRCPHCTSELA
ncbi:MAG: large conductance mechanosensitive channel protein MscL [Peptoniphilaceae bacterium]|nr:large conductance mechanosensitive channel protein MscL [Peptoniphilaceae bacterium]MDY6085798.1 large conductance mechanosensitive channel protein MscL [Peptoniphilaceae bacterium]